MPRFAANAFGAINPLLTFRVLPNMPAFHVSLNFDIQGPYTVSYPGIGQFYGALEDAWAALESKAIDVALVGGVADQRNFLVEHHFSRVAPPVEPSRLANAAAFITIERAADARARGAAARARLTGYRLAYTPAEPFAEIDPAECVTREGACEPEVRHSGPASLAVALSETPRRTGHAQGAHARRLRGGEHVGDRVSHRVAVTGMGVVCPIGQTVDEFRASLFAGRSGIGPITIFDPATLPTRIAAEVKWDGEVMRDRKVSFACAAAAQALADAGRAGTSPRGDGGLSLGLGLELFSMDDLAAKRAGHPAPVAVRDRLLYLQTPSDLCVSILAHRYQLTEPPVTHVSACASGTDAIGSAFRMIASGRRRWMMAGGADSMINPLGVAGFCSIGATSTANDDPPRASRPFDLDARRLRARRGRRRADPRETRGCEGARGDAVRRDRRLRRIVRRARHQRAAPRRTRRPAGDVAGARRGAGERRRDRQHQRARHRHAQERRGGDARHQTPAGGARAARCRSRATKSMIGHLIAAAGAVEAIAAVIGMNASVVHPTVNLDHPDPACDLDYVPHDAREHPQRCVLSNSFAFGGQNASIVFRRADV